MNNLEVVTFTNKKLEKYTQYIENATKELNKTPFKIAYYLNKIDEEQAFIDDYENIVEYAKDVFGYKKSVVYAMLKIGKEWLESKDRTVLAMVTDNDKVLSDYGFTHIKTLLPLGVEGAKNLHDDGVINPNMTVKDLQEVVKSLTVKEDVSRETLEDNTSELEEVDVEQEVNGQPSELSMSCMNIANSIHSLELPNKFLSDYEKELISNAMTLFTELSMRL